MKQGTVTVQQGKPLQFGDPVEADSPTTPERENANCVADSIKAYCTAAKDLLSSRYACYAEFMPKHLQGPCSTFVIRCSDGVFIRYDAAAEGEPKTRVTALNETLANIAPNFSEYFIHYGVDPENLNFDEKSPCLVAGIIDAGGAQRDSVSYRLGVFTTGHFPDGYLHPKPPLRPACLVSVTNELEVAMGGRLVPSDDPLLQDGPDVQHFVAHGRLCLSMGWLAIEIYPLLGDEHWRPEYAAAWAECDILAIAAQRNLQEIQLNTLDSRAETRKRYAALLAEFESLLQGPEEPIHQFLLQHPELLCPTYDKLWSKMPFGATKSDFVFRTPHNDYELVEIEAPGRQLFRQDGQQHADLTHAINQTSDWVRYIEDNKSTVERELGLTGISTNPRRLIVLGRSKSLTEVNRRKVTTLQNDQPKLRIQTYDDLLAGTRANLERILGPLGLMGQNVKLYYVS
jgi:hypothetical protein